MLVWARLRVEVYRLFFVLLELGIQFSLISYNFMTLNFCTFSQLVIIQLHIFLRLNSSSISISLLRYSGVRSKSLFSCSSCVRSIIEAHLCSFLALKAFRKSLKD